MAEDEHQLIEMISAYLSYFEGRLEPMRPLVPAAALRGIVPEDPRQPYDVREVISGLCDLGELLELRAGFAGNLVTALGRVDGFPVGFVASQPLVLAGAVDAPAADKISRFVQLCDAFGLPLVFLVDSPGFLVGPAAERSALMRHSTRVIHALAHARVPIFTVTLRKSYGLAHFALGGRPLGASMVAAWPTAEYGSMGPEGAAIVLARPGRRRARALRRAAPRGRVDEDGRDLRDRRHHRPGADPGHPGGLARGRRAGHRAEPPPRRAVVAEPCSQTVLAGPGQRAVTA